MRLLLLTAFVAVFSFAVYAAEISPVYQFDQRQKGEITWEQVNNDDTTGEAQIVVDGSQEDVAGAVNMGQLYRLLIEGTPNSVDLKLQAGRTSGSLVDIDTDQMPDGVRFSSASTGNHGLVCLTDGDFVDISFTSAGGGAQDIDIYLTPVGSCR